MVMILDALCNSMLAMEKVIWQYLGLSYDEVADKIERYRAERRLRKCKYCHIKSRHDATGCADCKCSTFVD